MKLFQQKYDAPLLGALLTKAREARGLTLEEAAREAHLSLEEARALEGDLSVPSRYARIQAISYLRLLGLNPADYKESLPPLPDWTTAPRRVAVPVENPLWQAAESLLGMLAPMGKAALAIVLLAALLGSWGMVRQLSRIRSVPWVSSTYSVPQHTP